MAVIDKLSNCDGVSNELPHGVEVQRACHIAWPLLALCLSALAKNEVACVVAQFTQMRTSVSRGQNFGPKP